MAASTRHTLQLLPTFQVVTGATASTYTFTKDVKGFATKGGATASTYTFTKAVAGVRVRFGATASTWTFNATTAGVRVRLGATASTYVFTKDVAGYATKTGATSSTWTFSKAVSGADTHFGATVSTWTFNATTAAKVDAHGATSSVWTFNATTVGTGGSDVVTNQGQASVPQRKRLLEGKPLHLKPPTARILVRAVAPQLTIAHTITSPTVRAHAIAGVPTITIGPNGPATITTIYRAERDLTSLDLDRELAVLLEA